MDSSTSVLLLIGPSQVGKSSFIKALAPHDVAKHVLVGDGGGMSTTSEVTIYKFFNTNLGNLVLIDVPGPDENRKLHDKKHQIMEMIARRLFIDASEIGSFLTGVSIFDNISFD